MKVSVIIPVYNEEKYIKECLESIRKQTLPIDIIVINDGSSDKTMEAISESSSNLKVLQQNHLGVAVARNLGAKEAKGEILVFVDADMVFEPNFIEELIKPILNNKTIGTFSKEEYVLNKDNIWSKCWNIEKGLPFDRMHNADYPNLQPVFRAILKKEFLRVGGFSPIGYIDDYTLSEKLGAKAVVAVGAKYYHRNPQTLKEVYQQARWIGKSEFKHRKIKSEWVMRFVLMVRHFFLLSLLNGLIEAVKFATPRFLIFKIVYDFALEISLYKSFFGEQKYK